ncbi:MAG: nucleotidyl transferase AbiEii/AbiGii toxin family protein [bacterium]
MHWDILDEKRKEILPYFSELKKYGFYLAGGTALALIIGHRDSIDFDFFTEKEFDTEKLFDDLVSVFSPHQITRTQVEKNTLSILIDGHIKVSFFTYRYLLLEEITKTEYFDIASLSDIACMKVNAVVNRATLKDYIDLYFILKQKTLAEIMENLKTKMPELDTLLALKSIIYFEDVDENEPIIFKTEKVSFEEIKNYLIREVKKL